MPKYRKKPVVIEAIQWTGKNTEEIAEFINGRTLLRSIGSATLMLGTLEGDHAASIGDYIIKGVAAGAVKG